MEPESRCTACGGELAAGSQFCGLCGARQPPACASCGTALAEGAAFCGNCGAAVGAVASAATPPAPPTDAAAPATPAAPAACGQCGEPLREGARFCRKCGASAVPGVVAPAQQAVPAAAQPQAASAQAIIDQLTWSSAAGGLGFIIALLSVFFPWAKASAGGASVEAGPLDDNALFRIGDVLGSNTSSIDGLATLLLAAAGLVALVASMLGRVNAATARSLTMGVGGALLALGFIEIQYVSSQPEPAGVSISFGFGLYLLVLGGALALASPWIPARRLKG